MDKSIVACFFLTHGVHRPISALGPGAPRAGSAPGPAVLKAGSDCGKLAVTTMSVLSPADCSRQMQQPPGRRRISL